MRSPDPAFLMLGSVSPTWRAIKTMERANARADIIANLHRKIDAWFKDPVRMAEMQAKKLGQNILHGIVGRGTPGR
jgi:hypothetical protein